LHLDFCVQTESPDFHFGDTDIALDKAIPAQKEELADVSIVLFMEMTPESASIIHENEFLVRWFV
jgi:hypothetical protein